MYVVFFALLTPRWDTDLKKKFQSTWYENQKETNLNEDWVFLTPKFKKMNKLSESVC